mmetsp:Transcript_27551/g.58215  ORF Transcript_27551/g.58215 Transcript_27551/m.58215 type:complete len:84 (-) Transcript_27551:186-437(-)
MRSHNLLHLDTRNGDANQGMMDPDKWSKAEWQVCQLDANAGSNLLENIWREEEPSSSRCRRAGNHAFESLPLTKAGDETWAGR